MDSDSFILKWSDHQSTVIQSFELLRREKDFYDVTLVSDDQQSFCAHKLVLSACSNFFRNILKNNIHSHPLLYLFGIKAEDLKQVLDFIYLGHVNLRKEDLDKFLEFSNKLEVKGVMLIENEAEGNDDVENPIDINDTSDDPVKGIMRGNDQEQNHIMLDDKLSQKSDGTFLGFDGGHGPMNSAKRIKTESAVSNTNVMNDEVFEKSYEVVYQTREQIQSNPMRKGSENMTFLQLRSQISEDAAGGIRKQVKTHGHPAAEQINFIQVSNQINENIVINHNTTNQNQQVIDNEETSIRSMAINQSKTRSLSPNLQGPVFQSENSYDAHMETTSTGYRCKFCLKETPRRWHMKNHIEIHLNNVYTCEVCGVELRTRNAYKKHQAAKHKM